MYLLNQLGSKLFISTRYYIYKEKGIYTSEEFNGSPFEKINRTIKEAVL
jgi:hypothetical protein